jgi:hypothetical protein
MHDKMKFIVFINVEKHLVVLWQDEIPYLDHSHENYCWPLISVNKEHLLHFSSIFEL